ncbi:hypothetical protein [Deinococcus aerophilus]|uniref:DUF11 domain-containing protein n=1 Tax=Deinococcus aerophilus TaxID=522488 RepID=A0ABQ2GIA4_9DEIO|nr:hypothetical protein [Deinococcus aerophilus]GGL96800.1 hypothetical protein GCM10010841_01480 [Deinococcus aerophilus]
MTVAGRPEQGRRIARALRRAGLLAGLALGGLTAGGLEPGGQARAQAPAPIIRNSVTFVMTQAVVQPARSAGGPETLVQSPRTALPGDVLREELTLRNVSGGRLARVEVAVPVPRETQFSGGVTPDTARWRVSYSVDGGQTYSPRPQRQGTGPAGEPRLEPAPPESYTHVRWVLTDLRADEAVKLWFRVKVRPPG